MVVQNHDPQVNPGGYQYQSISQTDRPAKIACSHSCKQETTQKSLDWIAFALVTGASGNILQSVNRAQLNCCDSQNKDVSSVQEKICVHPQDRSTPILSLSRRLVRGGRGHNKYVWTSGDKWVRVLSHFGADKRPPLWSKRPSDYIPSQLQWGYL